MKTPNSMRIIDTDPDLTVLSVNDPRATVPCTKFAHYLVEEYREFIEDIMGLEGQLGFYISR